MRRLFVVCKCIRRSLKRVLWLLFLCNFVNSYGTIDEVIVGSVQRSLRARLGGLQGVRHSH